MNWWVEDQVVCNTVVFQYSLLIVYWRQTGLIQRTVITLVRLYEQFTCTSPFWFHNNKREWTQNLTCVGLLSFSYRKLPTGGAAKGMPRKFWERFEAMPSTAPYLVFTTGPAVTKDTSRLRVTGTTNIAVHPVMASQCYITRRVPIYHLCTKQPQSTFQSSLDICVQRWQLIDTESLK